MPTTHVIVETYIQNASGLPKDRFENVWHFLDVTEGDPIAVASSGIDKIYDFFHTPPAGGGVAQVERYLAGSEGDTIHLVAYDFAAAKPRPEILVASFVYAPLDSTHIPEEVALCLSYYTDRNLPSHRGRLYIGPFNGSALGTGGAAGRPSTNLTTALTAGAARLIPIGFPAIDYGGLTNPAGVPSSVTTAWALYSPKLATFAAIEHGWVDDEWDGQSRRRVEASTRFLFP
jgi:hypothetical protein